MTGSVRPPVSPLRQRFIDDLRLRNYSPRTIETYVGRVAHVAKHFGRSPDTLGPDDIRAFQLHLLERKVSWSLFNQTVCALRFLFGTTLGRPEQLPLIPYGKRPQTLPSVLSPAEVVRLLEAAKPGRERVRLQAAYACGLRLWVRWDGRLVRLFNQRFEQIAVHVQHEAGRFSTLPQHIADEKISGVERGAEWLLQKVQRIGPHSTNWAESVIAARGVEGVRVVQGLLSLAKRYRSDQLERACRVAHSYRAHRLRTIRDLIDRDVSVQQEFDFMDEHPLIRPMSEYQQFVSDPVPHQGASG